MYDKRYSELLKECSKIRSRANRDAVDYIIDSARINANDTIRDDKERTLADWDWLFTGTIGGQLCTGEYNRYVVEFFTKRGITF
jgi:hypothetical protein